jgi:hypothetical protein
MKALSVSIFLIFRPLPIVQFLEPRDYGLMDWGVVLIHRILAVSSNIIKIVDSLGYGSQKNKQKTPLTDSINISSDYAIIRSCS